MQNKQTKMLLKNPKTENRITIVMKISSGIFALKIIYLHFCLSCNCNYERKNFIALIKFTHMFNVFAYYLEICNYFLILFFCSFLFL